MLEESSFLRMSEEEEVKGVTMDSEEAMHRKAKVKAINNLMS